MINQNTKEDEPIHPAYIIAELKRSGSSQTKLANALEVSNTAVNLVIHGKSKSERIAKAISEKTGLEIEKMWPDLYHSA